MTLHSRLERLERAQPAESDRNISSESLNWLFSETATTHPELNAHAKALVFDPDATPETKASALLDLSDAAGLTREFFNRSRKARTG